MNEDKKYLYTVKYFDKDWHYLPSMYLNPFDSQEEKQKIIDQIRKANSLEGCIINISNFNNVYV